MRQREHGELAEPPQNGHPAQPAEIAERRTREKSDPQDPGDDGVEPALPDVAGPDRRDRKRSQKDAASEPQYAHRASHRTVDATSLESGQQPAQRINPRQSD